MAVIRFDANLTGIDAGDATYLDNDAQVGRNAQVWGYGDGTLKQGCYEVQFDFSTGMYRSTPLPNDPRVCPGDSGGPLKRPESLREQDGIQIDIVSSFTGSCLAAGSITRFAAIQPNISFITGALPGRCADVDGLPSVGRVRLKRCW